MQQGRPLIGRRIATRVAITFCAFVVLLVLPGGRHSGEDLALFLLVVVVLNALTWPRRRDGEGAGRW